MRETRTLNSTRPGRWRYAPAVLGLAGLALAMLSASCATEPTPSEPRTPREVEVAAYLKDTVGELARVVGREDIPVQGLGFVTGLDGTGTRVVPPGIRQRVLDMMRRNKVEKAEELLSSPDTAVVAVTGWITPGMTKGEAFDLEVRVIPNTDTTSLDGGFVLECDLARVVSARGVETRSEPLALGRGSIFVSPFASDGADKGTSDPRVGRVLAGGKALKTQRFRLALTVPSVRTVDQVVRHVNARFPGAATGTQDPGLVDLEAPKEFLNDKMRFLDLVGALYLRDTPDARDQRIDLLVETLKAGEDMDRAALCLEAFGATVTPRLRTLADHPSEAVRFYVGRTMAGLQDAQAVTVLERVARDDASPFQEAAVEALGRLRSGVGLGVLGRALDAKSARVRVAAWQAMVRLTGRTFLVRAFEEKFALSAVATRGDPFVYVSRSLRPQIAVFGDVKVLPPVLAETRRVTASVLAGETSIHLIARRRGHDVRVEAPLDVKAVIGKLASPLGVSEEKPKPEGLDLGYSDVVGLLHEISRKKGLSAPVVLQPLTYRVMGDRPVARPISTAEGEK